MNIKVDVTQRDINRGECCNPCECPAAIAIRRATKIKKVWVYGDAVAFEDCEVPAPKSLRKFVQDFDEDGELESLGIGDESYEKPKPFSFTLRVKKECLPDRE
jgi:hypothetical protein